MIKLSAASAASLLLATLLTGSPARAYCDEDCAYERQEAAYERADERADERANREDEADEEGYGRRNGSGAQRARRGKASHAERPAELKPTARSQPKARTTKEEEQFAAPEPSTRSAQRSRSGPVLNENSSIVVHSSEVAEDDTEPRRRATSRTVGCKTYFPSVGMTLSVRCD